MLRPGHGSETSWFPWFSCFSGPGTVLILVDFLDFLAQAWFWNFLIILILLCWIVLVFGLRIHPWGLQSLVLCVWVGVLCIKSTWRLQFFGYIESAQKHGGSHWKSFQVDQGGDHIYIYIFFFIYICIYFLLIFTFIFILSFLKYKHRFIYI